MEGLKQVNISALTFCQCGSLHGETSVFLKKIILISEFTTKRQVFLLGETYVSILYPFNQLIDSLPFSLR